MKKCFMFFFLTIILIAIFSGCNSEVIKVNIDNVEARYKEYIEKNYNKEILEIDELIDISVKLFNKIKVKGIERGANSDMLLFQYGIYNWEGELFYFDTTRQFFLENDVDDEPYQLSLTLKMPPDFFRGIKSYDSFSSDFINLENWVENIKSTQGYIKAKELNQINSFEIIFSKV